MRMDILVETMDVETMVVENLKENIVTLLEDNSEIAAAMVLLAIEVAPENSLAGPVNKQGRIAADNLI